MGLVGPIVLGVWLYWIFESNQLTSKSTDE